MEDAAELRQVRELTGGRARATNPASGLEATFDAEGVSLERLGEGEWSARMRLERFGREGAMASPSPSHAHVVDELVAFERAAGLTEWFDNTASGLEHGFTLHERPAGQGTTLRLELSVAGARVEDHVDGALRFVGDGETVRYEKLQVWDARGETLHASMRATPGGFLIELDDADATYPVTVDPVFVQAARFISDEPTAYANFADRFEVVGGDIFVRAIYETVNGVDQAGSLYILQEDASGSYTKTRFISDAPADGERFGAYFEVDGERLFVLMRNETVDGLERAGAVYLFEKDASGSYTKTRIVCDNPSRDARFGSDLQVVGNLIVVSAGTERVDGLNRAGAVYVLEEVLTGALEQTRIVADTPSLDANFGTSMDLVGDRIFVSAYTERVDGVRGAGALYVLEAGPAGGFSQTRLVADTPSLNSHFGLIREVVGERLFLREFGETVDGVVSAGALYLLEDDATGALSRTRFTSDAPSMNARFSNFIEVEGDRFFVSAPGDEVNGAARAGAVYVLEEGANGAFSQTRIVSDVPSPDARFGDATGVVGDRIFVRASGETVNGATRAGAVYVLEEGANGAFSQTRFVSDTPTSDAVFGFRFEVVGDRVLVGSPDDEVGGAQKAGALYVLEEDASGSFSKTRLVSDAPSPGAKLGFPWKVSGDRIIVGAPDEEVDGDENAGAVYVFEGGSEGISSRARLVSDAPSEDANFGGALDVVGDRILVGAPHTTVNGQSNAGAFHVLEIRPSLTAVEDTARVDEGGEVVIVVIANDETEGAAAVTAVADFSAGGSATINENDSVVYTPATGFTGVETFVYTLEEGALRDTATVTVQVEPEGDRPTADDLTIATMAGEPVSFTLTGSDPEGQALTFSVEDPANGTLSGEAPSLTYTPGEGFEGNDAFSFTVSNGTLTSAPALITAMVTGQPNVAPIFVDPSPADGEVFERYEGELVSFTLAAQDEDAGPMALTLELVGAPESASFDPTRGTFSWDTLEGDEGTYDLTARATDGLDDVERTFTVVVRSTPRSPINAGADEGCCATAPARQSGSPALLVFALLALVGVVGVRSHREP